MPVSTRAPRGALDRRDIMMLAACLAVSVILLLILGDLPVFGDGWGYGYRSASWIAGHGMQPVAAGEGRGEQAMGHPTLMLWLWALLMNVLGDTILVAHIIPALLTGLALWGTYRFGSLLGGRAAGMWSAVILLSSPLFLAQSVQPLQDVGFTAFAVLAMREYGDGRNGRAALLTAAGTAFREQALLLAASFMLVELARNGISKPGRILVHLLSPAVLVLTGLGNLAFNGFFLYPTYLGSPAELGEGWLPGRIRLFAGHLLAGDGRWLLLTSAIAIALARQARKAPSVTAVLLLLSPAFLFPPERLQFLALMGAAGLLAVFREGRMPDTAALPAAVFALAMIAFHVLVVSFAPDPQLNLFRYVLAAYPAVIACTVALIRNRGGIRLLHPLAAASALACVMAGTRTLPNQPDATPAGLATVYDTREMAMAASALGDTVVAPETECALFGNPALGYVDSPVPCRRLGDGTLDPGASYIVFRPWAEAADPEFDEALAGMLVSETVMEPVARAVSGGYAQVIYRLEPAR